MKPRIFLALLLLSLIGCDSAIQTQADPVMDVPFGLAGLSGSAGAYTATVAVGGDLFTGFRAYDANGDDSLTLRVTVTGETLDAATAGFTTALPASKTAYAWAFVTLEGTAAATGDIELTATATDSRGATCTCTLTITIVPATPTGIAPTITSTAPTGGTVGTLYTYDVQFTGDLPVTLTITANKPTWLNVFGDGLVGVPDQATTFADIEITATNAYGTDTETFSITVLPGSAASLVFATHPTDTAADATIPSFTVEVRDTSGSVVTGYTGDVTVALDTIPTPSATLSGTTTRACVAGVATFDDLAVDYCGSGFTLFAYVPGLPAAYSDPFAVTANRWVFTVEPDAVVGVDQTFGVTVAAQDAHGHTDMTLPATAVTLALQGPAATLSGTNPVTTTSGVATFTDLSIDTVDVGYTLQATDGTLANGTSDTIEVTDYYVSFATQPMTVAVNTLLPPIEVQVEDVHGALLSSYQGPVTISMPNNPSALNGTLTVDAVNGIARFIDLTVAVAATFNYLQATVDGTHVATSVDFDVYSATWVQLGLNPQGYPEYDYVYSGPNGSMTMRFVAIPGGTFQMGDTTGNGGPSELPVHSVTVPEFLLAKHECTQAQWSAVMGSWTFGFPGNPNRPAEQISWNDIQNFEAATGLRLPSEAEWEYACRAGTTTDYYWGENIPGASIDGYAWYSGNSGSQTHNVGGKAPNGLGLHDMSGNVWEWVQDRWHDDYTGAPTDGSAWEFGGSSGRVSRGGSWFSLAGYCRSAGRGWSSPGGRGNGIGFRPARSP